MRRCSSSSSFWPQLWNCFSGLVGFFDCSQLQQHYTLLSGAIQQILSATFADRFSKHHDWGTHFLYVFSSRKNAIFSEIKVDGEFTLNENVCDIDGLNIATEAFADLREASANDLVHLPNNPYSPQQLFFINTAQVVHKTENSKVSFFTDFFAGILLACRPRLLRSLPGAWWARAQPWTVFMIIYCLCKNITFMIFLPSRIDGTMMNSKLFNQVFQCPVGSRMNPPGKCTVWTWMLSSLLFLISSEKTFKK